MRVKITSESTIFTYLQPSSTKFWSLHFGSAGGGGGGICLILQHTSPGFGQVPDWAELIKPAKTSAAAKGVTPVASLLSLHTSEQLEKKIGEVKTHLNVYQE